MTPKPQKPLARMMVTDSDLRAIGHVAAQWARLEVQIDLLIARLLDQPSVVGVKTSLRSGTPPKSFERRIDLLREMTPIVFSSHPALVARIERTIQDASHLRGNRDEIIHGVWKLKRDKRNKLTTGVKLVRFHPFRFEEKVIESHFVEEIARKISLVYWDIVMFMQEVFQNPS